MFGFGQKISINLQDRNGQLNLRMEPDINSQVLFKLTASSKLAYAGEWNEQGWLKVIFTDWEEFLQRNTNRPATDYVGWVSSRYINSSQFHSTILNEVERDCYDFLESNDLEEFDYYGGGEVNFLDGILIRETYSRNNEDNKFAVVNINGRYTKLTKRFKESYIEYSNDEIKVLLFLTVVRTERPQGGHCGGELPLDINSQKELEGVAIIEYDEKKELIYISVNK